MKEIRYFYSKIEIYKKNNGFMRTLFENIIKQSKDRDKPLPLSTRDSR